MEADATDREIESYVKKLEWAGIEIDRRRHRNTDLQPTTAAGSGAALLWASLPLRPLLNHTTPLADGVAPARPMTP
jgi:hypothetical protein